MHVLKRALTLTMLTAIPIGAFSCPPETWSGVTSDQWNVSTNWNPSTCIPGSAVPDEATFGAVVGNGPIIFLDLPTPIEPALMSLTFNNAATSYTISTTGSQFLVFLNVPNNFLIVNSGSHTLNARAEIFSSSSPNTLNVQVNSGSQLTIGGAITNTFGISGSIAASGGGELEFLNNGTAKTITSVQGSITTSINNFLNLNTTSIASGVGSEISAGSGFSVTSGTATNRNTGTLTGGTGAFITGSAITQSGGTFINQNQGGVSGGAVGSEVQTGDTASFTGGTFQNLNSGTVTGATGSELFATLLNINGGTVSSVNSSGTITGANAIGTYIFLNGTFSLSSGTFSLLNQSAVASAGSFGCEIFSFGITISGGNFNSTNQGAISNATAAGCFTNTTGNIILTGGTITNSNEGTVTDGVGTHIMTNSGSMIMLDGGSVTNINSGTVANPDIIGALIEGLTGITSNGGTVTNSNTGPVSNSGNGSVLASGDPIVLNGGTVINSNTGPISSTAMGSVLVTGDLLKINVGTVSSSNSGVISGGGTGCLISCSAVDMTGGKLINNGPRIPTADGFGNLITAGTFTSTISGGTLINNDTFQGVGIQTSGSGLLAGTGIFSNIGGGQTILVTNGTSTIGAGGFVEPDTLSPGNPGVMTIQGSYIQNASGTLIINVFSPTNFSELLVTSNLPSPQGTATINGGTLDLNIPIGALPPGTATFPIIVANHGVSGAFSNIVNTNPFVRASVAISGDSFVLTTTSISSAPTTKLTNFPSVVFSNLSNLKQMIEQQIFQMNTVISQNEMIPSVYPCAAAVDPRQRLYASTLPMEELIAQEAPEKKATKEKKEQLIEQLQSPPIPNPLTIYFGPIGTLGNYLTKHGQTGYHYWSGGGLFGFNYAFRQFGIGSSLSYQHTHENIKHHGGHSDTDEIDLNVYGSFVPASNPQFALSAIIGAGYQWNSFPRITGFTGEPVIAKGFPHGWDFTSTLGVQYTFMNPPFGGLPYGLQIVPLADVQYSYLSVDHYREHRAGEFNFKYKMQNTKSFKLDMGLLVNYTFFTPTTSIRPQVILKWRREFLYKHEKSSFAYVDLDIPYATMISKAPNLNCVEATFDLLTMFYGRYGIDIFYNFEWNTWYHDHTAYVNGTLSF